VLQVAAVQPLALVGPGELGAGGHGQVEEPAGVAAPGRRQLAGGRQLLLAELADRLQHREPGLAGGALDPGDQRLAGQRGDRVQGVEAEPGRVANRLGRRRRPAAGEHRQPVEQALFRRGQQVVAPGDGAAQGPLAVREGGPGPPVSRVRRRWSRGRICSGVRTLVRVAARSGGRSGSGRASGGTSSSCSTRTDSGTREVTSTRSPGGAGQQPLDHRPGLRHLLEVVHHEQEPPVAQMVGQGVGQGPPGDLGDPQGPGDRRRDQGGVGHRGQVDEEGAVAVLRPDPVGDLEGQAGLAGAAGPGEGEQPGPSQEPDRLGDLVLAADERGELLGQVAGAGVERPGRREVGLEPRDHQVMEVQGEVDVLEAVLPQVTQGRPIGQGAGHQPPGGAGDDHLPAPGRPGDPGRPVHVDADVVVPAQHPLPGVQAHAHPDRGPRRPGVGGQGPLGGHGRPDRRHRAGEGGEEGVALGADLDPVAVADRPAQDGRMLVPDRRVAVAQLLEQPGRAFDVGEQEGDRPGGQRRDGRARGHRRRSRRRGHGPLGQPPPAQLQPEPEQHRGHPQGRHHGPQDPGGRGQRLPPTRPTRRRPRPRRSTR